MIVIKWSFGKDLINCLSSKVKTFLSYSDVGAEMIYGYLITGKPFIPDNYNNNTDLDLTVRGVMVAINDSGSFGGSGMMFKVLSMIYFLSFFVSMLYYLGVLQAIVLKLGWLLSKTVGTTAAESTNAAANIFLGQTEAPLLIKPFLPVMTKSEIHAVMTGGFATIAGTVLGAYIGIGIDANNLITASVMAAPTALAVSKLFYPETEESKTTIKDLKVENEDDANVLDAAAKGASTAIGLVLNIAASLIAFKSFVAFLDALIGWFGDFAGAQDLSFQILLGYLFWPLAWIMGVRAEDCLVVAKLIGMKLLVTELPAFQELGIIKKACGLDETSDLCTLEERSITICTFALCGFANFASIGMQIGGLSGLCPERKSDFAQVVFRAMIAGCWVSFLNACIAGALL
ncbi:sodium/nucleoside cotransporter 1 [Eurytemora carolleeae]|uniref:sodium/nucleoside cotransporter 1 n=1 Tax=Eurytemora carolleeae TaxID=1294199 RepID=UPI000C781331|nr:sodium/nucleoside cotransporter 1 [Eurytemora carolleeae]|eukprot:XP_023339611.1 sodium/nucleoside cotransporter 1-like [Eurytemora affinis]